MDIQVLDETGKRGAVMQQEELRAVLDYAEKWAGISNDTEMNREVQDRITALRKVLSTWRAK